MQTSIADRVAKADVVSLKLTELELDNRNRAIGPLDELAADIKKHGVLQAVIVRQRQHGKLYQVVAGNRRVAAASAAGLALIPARVLELDDDEAVEVQAVENLQRKDLHPLDECELYERLLEHVEGGPAEVAARVGRDVGHVYQRLALRGLPASAQKLLRAGELELVIALAVARIPDPGVREKAAVEVAKVRSGYVHEAGGEVRQRMSVAEALAFIRNRFMLRLADAPFDRTDVELVPGAGACGPCPKRTGGNAAGLFGDLLETKDGSELCTDPKCFDAKVGAAWTKSAEKFAAAGHEVLDMKASAKVFREHSDEPEKGWADVNDSPNYYTDKAWRQILGKHVPEKLTVARDREGKVRWLAKESTLNGLAKKHGITIAEGYSRHSSGAKPDAAARAKQRKDLYGRKLMAAARTSALAAFADAAGEKHTEAIVRRMLIALADRSFGRYLKEGGRTKPDRLVEERRQAKKQGFESLARATRGLPLLKLAAEFMAADALLETSKESEWGKPASELAAELGVDLDAIADGTAVMLPDRVKRLLEKPKAKTPAPAKKKGGKS